MEEGKGNGKKVNEKWRSEGTLEEGKKDRSETEDVSPREVGLFWDLTTVRVPYTGYEGRGEGRDPDTGIYKWR